MSRRSVEVAGQFVTVAFDDPSFLAMRWWGVARYQMLDEQSSRPIAAAAALATAHPKVVARGGADGLVGAVARPWDLLNPLLRADVTLDARVSAPGYLDRHVAPRVAARRFSLAANAATDTLDLTTPPTGLSPGQRVIIGTLAGTTLRFEFATIRSLSFAPDQIRLTGNVSQTYLAGPNTFVVPDEFAVDASARGQLAMHRQPTMLAGRVTEIAGGAVVPIAGAEVRVREVWRLDAQVGVTPPPDGPQVAWEPPVGLLNVPLYADFPLAGTQVRMQNRAVDGAVAAKQLTAAAARGEGRLALGDGAGLSPGDVVSIDDARPDIEELIEVTAIEGALIATDPVQLRLAHPLRHAHGLGAVVRRLVPPPAGPPTRALLQEALASDPVLLLDMTGAGSEGQVEVFHPGPPVVRCHHRMRRYRATTNADGVFHLPLARVSRLTAAAFGPPPGFLRSSAPVLLEPDYAMDENRFDCLIP